MINLPYLPYTGENGLFIFFYILITHINIPLTPKDSNIRKS